MCTFYFFPKNIQCEDDHKQAKHTVLCTKRIPT